MLANHLSSIDGYHTTFETGYNRLAVMTNDRAPGDLALIERFINTADRAAGTDQLIDTAGLAGWVESTGLPGAGEELDDADRRRVVELREALRELLAGGDAAPEAVAALERAGSDAPLVVAFGADGSARLAPAGTGASAVIAALLAIVARAQADGTWSRLKACAAESCGWAFYDRSRNRSRSWCSMSVCGNRAKARSFRARQR
jgi:predicted RNA-binding Zn ribbon-like protein